MTPEFTPTLPMHTKSRSLGLAAPILATVVCALLLFCGIAPAARAHAQTPTLIVMRAMPGNAKKSEDFAALHRSSRRQTSAMSRSAERLAPVTCFASAEGAPVSCN